MLVNAQQFPGPALWQGIMLIVALIWMVWMFRSVDRSSKQIIVSIAIVVAIGIALLIAIVSLT